jgi:predicted amidohydrolase
MATLAKLHNSFVIFSMPEKSQEKFYQSAILIDPQGQTVGVYHKSHLNENDKQWASAGDDLPVFSTAIGRIGLVIGDEVRIPDISMVMAVKRADIIAIPSSWKGDYAGPVEMASNLLVKPFPNNTMFIWYNMAKYAQAYTLVANYVGQGYQGGSGLYSLNPIQGHFPPIVASVTEPIALAVDFSTLASADWWINQNSLTIGRRAELTVPILLDNKSPCFQKWQQDSDKNHFCWD